MLAAECTPNNADANDKLEKVLSGIGLDTNTVLDEARADKAEELVREYVRGERQAVTPGAALAPRETRFATRSVSPFVPFQPCQRRWKSSRVRSPGPVPTRKPKNLRAASPKRRSIYAACAMHAINSSLIL